MRSKRRLALAALTLVVAALGMIPLHPRWLAQQLARHSPEVLYFVETERRVVALTIDDGPDSTSTSRILDLLRQHDARATFFIIGERVAGNEALLRRMVEEEHELGNHLGREEPSIRLPPDEFERQLLATHAALSDYSEVRWFRPGSGWFNDGMLATLRRHGYSCALGSVFPLDTEIPSSWLATRYILKTVRPGSVIVLHDVSDRGLRTAATLETILPELEARGFEVVTLSTLVGMADPMAEGP